MSSNEKSAVSKGFSLIEIAVVLALIAMTATLSLASINFFNGLLVKSEMQRLYAACLYMQQCARVSNKPECLYFDINNNSYSFDGRKEQLSAAVRFGVLPGVRGSPGSLHGQLEKPITFVNNCITFYPNGIIQSGTVYCVDVSNQYLYALSCGVSHSSHLRIYRYDGTWQLLG